MGTFRIVLIKELSAIDFQAIVHLIEHRLTWGFSSSLCPNTKQYCLILCRRGSRSVKSDLLFLQYCSKTDKTVTMDNTFLQSSYQVMRSLNFAVKYDVKVRFTTTQTQQKHHSKIIRCNLRLIFSKALCGIVKHICQKFHNFIKITVINSSWL